MVQSVVPRCRRGCFSLAGIVLLAILASFGRSAAGGDSDKLAAKAHHETATRLYDVREYDKAVVEYKAAYVAQPDPAFLFNIGQCYRKLGQDSEALHFFQQYLKKAPADDPNRRQVEARISEIETEPGPKTSAAPIAPGPLTPASDPSSLAPSLGSSPRLPGLSSTPASLHKTPSTSAASESSGRDLRNTGIAVAATGLASCGAALYYYTRARSFSDRVTNSQDPIAAAAADESGRNAQTMQWVLYSVGAGALATGAVLYWMGRKPARSSSQLSAVAPMLGPSWAGIAAQGAF